MLAVRRSLSRLEDIGFYLAGPGHSGTTWLCSILRQHPAIFIPPESNFLTWRHRTHNIQDFFQNQEAELFGEHGNNYWSFEGVPEKLAAINPAAKIVGVVQDPIRRIIRNYRHDRMYGVVPRFMSLEIMLQENFLRSRYIIPSLYADNLRRWLKHFPADQIFLYWMETQDVMASLKALFDFLSVGAFEPNDMGIRKNVSVFPLSPLTHRHALFGDPGVLHRWARVVDPLNCWLGAQLVGPPKIKEADIAEAKMLLGEQVSLEPLRELMVAEGVRGNL